MLRITPKLTAVLLCGSMLAGCATLGVGGASSNSQKQAAAAAIYKNPPTDLDSGVRQAQLMRTAGQNDEAIRVLSQLMMVASDDPRVVAEYGKNLAEKGRAQDASEFLGRAIQLSPNDWTLYSALGVSYDQLGNQTLARAAYDHALLLKPEEPSVLNNYALSRMMAGDAAGARVLIGRAQAAGGGSDSKIAANIALLNKVALNADVTKDVAMLRKAVSEQPESPAQTAAVKPVAAAPPVSESKPAAASQAVATPPAVTPRPLVASLPPIGEAKPLPAGAQQIAPKPAAPAAQASLPKPKPAAPVVSKGTAVKAAPAATATAMLQPPKIEIYDPPSTKQAAPAKPADAKASAKSAPVRTASKDGVPALRLTADARSP